MPRVLISGASGFVGRALIPALCNAGFKDLLVVDRKPLPACTRNAAMHSGGEIRELVSDRLPVPSEYPDIEFMVCLAGATSVDAALVDPRPAVEGNLRIAVDLAEWTRARQQPVYVVYVSSDEVLGEAFEPLPHSASLRPTQPYAASKAAAEIVVHCYRDVYGLDIATIRSCNLIGPGQREPKLVPVAVRALLHGNAVPIHGTGHQIREWMAVDDFASAIITLMRQRAAPAVYQAATGVHRTVRDVVELVARALETPLSIQHVPDRLVQDMSYAMDPSRLVHLGWSPKHDPTRAIQDAALAIAGEIHRAGDPMRSQGRA